MRERGEKENFFLLSCPSLFSFSGCQPSSSTQPPTPLFPRSRLDTLIKCSKSLGAGWLGGKGKTFLGLVGGKVAEATKKCWGEKHRRRPSFPPTFPRFTSSLFPRIFPPPPPSAAFSRHFPPPSVPFPPLRQKEEKKEEGEERRGNLLQFPIVRLQFCLLLLLSAAVQ